MLKREKSGAGTRGIAADAPIFGGTAAQGVKPLASTGAVGRGQSPAPPLRLKIARLAQAHLPESLVC